MPVIRALVTLNPAAEPEDRYVNTWHFINADLGVTVADAAIAAGTALNTFYQSIDAHMTTALSGSVPEVRWYDISEPKIRVPFSTVNLTALATGTSRAVTELAICLSYNAQYESGQEPRRRRGRIYLGPWHNTAVDTGTGRVSGTVVTAIANAAQVFLDASQASTAYKWVVYSRADDPTESGNVAAGREVIRAFVDNEFDIQRRRGQSSGVRTVVT